MKKSLILLLIFIYTSSSGQTLSICSWNIKDFGKSKPDSTINFIAEVVRHYDVVAIQEVVAGHGGAQAVARLADKLNRMGDKWDYVVSEPTSGITKQSSERYAYFWKTNKVSRKGEAWLEKNYHAAIDREPFLITLVCKGKSITLVNFHAIPKSKQPETEIKYLKFFPAAYGGLSLFFLGDFNLPQSHSVFNPLKSMGYKPALKDQKTSLKTRCMAGDCLASEFDNMFYNSKQVRLIKSGIVKFYDRMADFTKARKISDHVPVFAEILLN